MNVLYLIGIFLMGGLFWLNLLAVRYPENMPPHITGELWDLLLSISAFLLYSLLILDKKV